MSSKVRSFPSFTYYLDESDPDIVILRRQDGSFVAAFSVSGATREGIVEAAKDDLQGAGQDSTGRQSYNGAA